MNSTLTITCAKPACHWRGSPADANGHTCPTPADAGDESVVNIQPPDSPTTSDSSTTNEVAKTEVADPPVEEPEPTVTDLAHQAEAAAPPPDPKGTKLFDASDYDREDLQLPTVDGHGIDRIALNFSGEIMLDRSNPDHVALYRRLKLFKNVDLWINASVKGQGTTGATNRDGDLDVVVGKRTLKVEHVRIIPPEGMQAAAEELAAQARDAAEEEENDDV